MRSTSTPLRPFSRRRLVAGAAASGAALSLPLSSRSSAAAYDAYLPPVRPYDGTPLADTATRHMADRFGYGYTPALGAEMRSSGGPMNWFSQQLSPGSIADTFADGLDNWFPTMFASAATHANRAENTSGYAYDVVADHGRWSLLRRTYSRRPVHEVLTEFWCNHLHVHSGADLTWFWRHDYDAVVRRHALGRFDEMLQAVITHPAMLVYLDGDLSQIVRRDTPRGVETTERINENLGRELLELHTVGRGAVYTEADVRDSAYLLTGWTVDREGTWECYYDPQRHYTGPVRVLGFSADNKMLDGRGVLRDYLRYLAHHPATAERIARKLAVRFVSDTPSEGLVAELARAFQDSGTDISTTLQALVRHPEFAASAGKKVRTPTEDVVATLRVLGVQIHKPSADQDAANAIYYQAKNTGQVPFGWEFPDGFPDTAGTWSSGARMMGSFQLHAATAGGYWPKTGVTYRLGAAWLPQPRIRFDALVDHLCRVLHGRGSTSLLLGAACLAVDQSPSDIITRDHVLTNYRMPRLIGLLLDTPQHLTR